MNSVCVLAVHLDPDGTLCSSRRSFLLTNCTLLPATGDKVSASILRLTRLILLHALLIAFGITALTLPVYASCSPHGSACKTRYQLLARLYWIRTFTELYYSRRTGAHHPPLSGSPDYIGPSCGSPSSMSRSDVEEGHYCPDWGFSVDLTAFLSYQFLLSD
jgi:hypothetical protein